MADTEYKDNVTYSVVFTSTVRRGPFRYLPRDNPIMSGIVLKEIIQEYGADVVRSAIAAD